MDGPTKYGRILDDGSLDDIAIRRMARLLAEGVERYEDLANRASVIDRILTGGHSNWTRMYHGSLEIMMKQVTITARGYATHHKLRWWTEMQAASTQRMDEWAWSEETDWNEGMHLMWCAPVQSGDIPLILPAFSGYVMPVTVRDRPVVMINRMTHSGVYPLMIVDRIEDLAENHWISMQKTEVAALRVEAFSVERYIAGTG